MLIDINNIKINERIRKDFGNIEELANDIKENGLINPPVVTPNNELIAGERRLKACKSLGYQQLEVRIMSVKDSEHQLKIEISENENRKEFTFSERIDWAKRLERVESIKAKERQSELNGKIQLTQNSSEAKGETREIVADKSGFGSHDTYNKAKYISENASEDMIKDLDDGKLSVNKAYTTLKQEKELLSLQNKDLQDKLKLSSELEIKVKTMEAELLARPTIETEKEVIPSDYEDTKKKLLNSDKDYKKLSEDYQKNVSELNKLKEEINSLKSVTEEAKYAKKLKDGALFFCGRVDDFIEKTGGFVWLSEHINELPEYEKKSYLKAIDMIENWAFAMKSNMKNYL